jgi:hypothetical protein
MASTLMIIGCISRTLLRGSKVNSKVKSGT